MSKKHRAGSLAFLLDAFDVSGQLLHDLDHEAAHDFRYLILHLPGGMGVVRQTSFRFRERPLFFVSVAQILGGGRMEFYKHSHFYILWMTHV